MNSSENLLNGYSLKELGLLDSVSEKASRSNSKAKKDFLEKYPNVAEDIFDRVDCPRGQAEHFEIKWGQADSILPIILYSTEALDKTSRSNWKAMEELFLRFPLLAEKIFGLVDDTKLTESRMISRNFKMYIDQQKFHNIRIMKSIIKKFHEVNEHWKKMFKGSSTIIIEELLVVVKNTYGKKSMQEKLFKENNKWTIST